MEKNSNKFDKKEYLPPVLFEYGTVSSITKAGGDGILFDADRPENGFRGDTFKSAV